MTQKNFDLTMEIPAGVEVNINDNLVSVKGAKGEIKKQMNNPRITIKK